MQTNQKAAYGAGIAALMVAAGMPTMALAHHAMGGVTPTTFLQGLLSGVAHPVLGPDHLAFIVGTGILVAMSSRWMWLPAIFLAGLAPGVLTHVAGVTLGPNELFVGLSVALLLEERIPVAALAAVMLLAGFCHGYAFGESGGATAAPVTGYLVGLAVIVMGLTTVVAWATRKMAAVPLTQRIASGALILIGTVFTIQNLIG